MCLADLLRETAISKGLPKPLLNGFGWMATENGGPGTISVILEAQARLCGQASAVDTDDAEISSVRVLRSMIFGHSIRPLDMADFICTVMGTLDGTSSNDNAAENFWLRFSKDALAVPGSAESIMLQQLLLGRGVGEWSPCGLPVEEQATVITKLIERIERGAPPVSRPPPDEAAVAAGGALLAEAFADSEIDEAETRLIFKDYDTDHGGSLDMGELNKVVLSIIKTARQSAVDRSEAADDQDTTDKQQIEDRFKDILRHYGSDAGKQQLATVFDPSGDGDVSEDEFVVAFPEFVRSLGSGGGAAAESQPESKPDPEPEPEPEPEPAEQAETFDSEANAQLSKEEQKAAKQAAKAKAKAEKQKAKELAKSQKKKDKAAKKAAKQRAKQNAGNAHEDSDEDEEFTGAKVPAPRGAKELFAYLARPGPAAPRGLASTLYIAVNERLPHSVAMSMFYLVIGADLGPRDVANLLALTSLQKKSVEHASNQCESSSSLDPLSPLALNQPRRHRFQAHGQGLEGEGGGDGADQGEFREAAARLPSLRQQQADRV